MYTQYRFIPGSALTNADLVYVLSPDELIQALRHTPNMRATLAQLPKMLSASLGDLQNSMRVLELLRFTLGSAQWVALATVPRQQPITGQRLNAYPALRALISGLEHVNHTPVKSNYKAVQSDVVLPALSTLNHTSPQAERKIVVELAGQWPANKCYFTLSKTEQQAAKSTKPKQDNQYPHRSLAQFSGLSAEPRNLYISIPMDGQTTPLQLLVAEGLTPVEKATEMDEWENVFIPLQLLSFLDDSASPEKAGMLRGGYLYLIWQDAVWRELQITSNGALREVDLTYYRGHAGNRTSEQANRYVELMAYDELGIAEPYAQYEFTSANGRVYQGEVGSNATVWITGLDDESIDVTFTSSMADGVRYTFVRSFETLEASQSGYVSVKREAQGKPMPHVWVPYKINGEQQKIRLVFSAEQLNEGDLELVVNSPEELPVNCYSLDELELYSTQQNFESESQHLFQCGECNADYLRKPGEAIRLDNARLLCADSGVLAENRAENIAHWAMAPPPRELYIQYQFDDKVDCPQDFYQLQDADDPKGWSQRRPLGERVGSKSTIRNQTDDAWRLLRFGPIPPEVERVNLVRGNAFTPISIPVISNVAVQTLLTRSSETD
ncbi:hypothetical protein [Thaumasiovibrio sp. DFM-14]|uniref:hypothetical protein n=1 Tax=Thaumasiovibrio sp. DFM-14 TaxID=3384792 RepID=UPI0039A1E774